MDKHPEEDREPSELTGDVPETQPAEVAPEPVPSEPAGDVPETQPAEGAPEPASSESAPQPEPPRHRTSEEALAEMRQSLREEEGVEATGFGARVGRFVRKVFRRKKLQAEEQVETPSRLDDMLIPEAPPAAQGEFAPPTIVEEAPRAGEAAEAAPPEAPGGGDFRDLVRQKMTGALPGRERMEPLMPPAEPPAAREEAIEFLAPATPRVPEEQPAPSGKSILAGLHKEDEAEVAEQPSEIRQEALEDYVLEPEAEEQAGGLLGRLRRSWRDMRPLDRNLLVGALVLIAVVFLGGSGYLVVQSLPAPTPTLTPTASLVPIPVSLTLPGGWVFPLSTGHVVNGKWDPTGAQWLQGTEVCRWVSLPWTEQLEAVLRTLRADDPLQLSMSNYDSLTYKVKAIQQVAPSEIQQMATDTPCLLVILTKQDSSTRWVVKAKP